MHGSQNMEIWLLSNKNKCVLRKSAVSVSLTGVQNTGTLSSSGEKALVVLYNEIQY